MEPFASIDSTDTFHVVPYTRTCIACGVASAKIADMLVQSGIRGVQRPAKYIFMGFDMTRYCFRIQADGPDARFDTISLSVPPDAQCDRQMYEIINSPVMEIALIKDGELVYVDEIGYSDVLRFYEYVDLLSEVECLISL